MSSPREEIAAQRRAWVAAVCAGDLDAYSGLFTRHIVWFPPGVPALEGRGVLRDWLQPFFDEYAYDFSLEVDSLSLAGNHAVESGRFVSRMTAAVDGDAQVHAGRYLVLWRRGPEGWKIDRYLDITGLKDRLEPG